MNYCLQKDYHVAVPTAFDEDEELNVNATIEHIAYLQKMGVSSVLVCGSTGEQHSLSFEEKCVLLDTIEEDSRLDNRIEILFGVASIRQKEAVALAQLANEKTKISGILVGFSPYVIPTQEEAIGYVNSIVLNYHKPIILYNNPKRTGFNLEIPSLLKLIEIPNIIGLKEAGDATRIPELKEKIADSFYFYAGGEIDLEKKVKLGFNRLSSIAGNLYPLEVKEWFKSLLEGNNSNFHLENKVNELFENSPIVYLKDQISKKEGIAIGISRKPLGNHSEKINKTTNYPIDL